MAFEQIGNLAASTLAAGILSTDTTLTVAAATGFPAAPFRALITDGSNNELVKVTGKSGTTFTVTRGIEGTSAAGWSSGATIKHILTAGALTQRSQDMMLYDTAANRPAAGVAARLFYASDTHALSRDNGASWVTLVPASAVVGARVSLASAASIANNTAAMVSWTTVEHDDSSLFAAGSPTKLTAPATGWYSAGGMIHWAANGTGNRNADIRVNGTAFPGGTSNNPVTGHAIDVKHAFSVAVYLTAGDYIEMLVFQNSGGALNISEGAMFLVRIV